MSQTLMSPNYPLVLAKAHYAKIGEYSKKAAIETRLHPPAAGRPRGIVPRLSLPGNRGALVRADRGRTARHPPRQQAAGADGADLRRRGGAAVSETATEIETCAHGHPYTPTNTRWHLDRRKRPRRVCRTCDKAVKARRLKRKRQCRAT